MFEEFIAQGNDMIRRQQLQVGLSSGQLKSIPESELVSLIEASAWRGEIEQRIRNTFGPDAYARYCISWQVFRDEVEKKKEMNPRVTSMFGAGLWLILLSWMPGSPRKRGPRKPPAVTKREKLDSLTVLSLYTLYASFSPSSAIPIFDSRYLSAFRDRPSNRAA